MVYHPMAIESWGLQNVGGIAPNFVSVAIENLLCIDENILYNYATLFISRILYHRKNQQYNNHLSLNSCDSIFLYLSILGKNYK